MDDLAKLITSPSWWVSAIVVAFLVNVAAAYLDLGTSALRQFKRFRGLRRVIDKCSQAIYSYNEMPVRVVQELEEQAEST
jgi:hypothetical protein